MERQISFAKDGTFQPIFLEHASVEGKWFYKKKELRDWCRKEKVESGALL